MPRSFDHYMAAILSDLVYEDWAVVKDVLRNMDFIMLGAPISHAGAQCMMVRDSEVGFLVFRGTEASKGSIRDILSICIINCQNNQ